MQNLKISFLITILVMIINNAYPQRQDQTNHLFINEFMASNVLSFPGADGEYADWIEIFNADNLPVDLAGYYLTNSVNPADYWQIPTGELLKTTIPGRGYLILYADKMPTRGTDHLNFKLNREHGEIALISPDKLTIIDKVTYSTQFRDISYGRSPNSSNNWVYFEDITPGEINKQGYTGFSDTPLVNQPAGFYHHNVLLTVQPARIGDMMRFELDGTDPTVNSPVYSSPILLDQTAIFKVRVFQSDVLPGPIVSRAFFIDVNHTLPVLALIIDPQNLYDPTTGIYVNDADGREWERYAELEFFKNQQLEFHIPAGIRIQGNSGPAAYSKKSFRAFFRNGYGSEKLNYPLYSQGSVNAFSRLVLRSGYDDSIEPTTEGKNIHGTLIRDPLATRLWQQCGGFVPRSHLAVLYLNHHFQGIYDIKESIDENFLIDHFGYNDFDIMRTRWDSLELVDGDRQKWNELVHFFEKNFYPTDSKIAEARQLMDLDNFITLQAFIHATQYKNWGYGVFMFREKSDNGRWQWTIWDADRAFIESNWNSLKNPYNSIAAYLDNLITKKLLLNQSFKEQYLNRLADLLNTVFLPENVTATIDSLAQAAPEMSAEVSRWNSTIDKWNENIEFLKNFAEKRPAIVYEQMQNYFYLKDPVELTIGINNGKGKIKINRITIDKFPWTGKYFEQITITITALPAPGYCFAGWSDASLPAKESITLTLTRNKSISAIFKQTGHAYVELITPDRVKPGQHFPFVVRIRDANGEINPIDQTPVQIKFSAAHPDTLIQIKRGAGTGLVQINADADFTLSIQQANLPIVQKQIEISSVPTNSYSGNLSGGAITWDNSADRLITGNLTIPTGCNLTIKPGTWIVVKKNVIFFIQGKLIVEGSESEPVVITSENWAEPWGGMEFTNTAASFRYCIVLNGGGDPSRGNPASDSWHTGHQHIFFGKNNSEFNFDHCFFLYSPGKVFGALKSKVNVSNSVSAFVWHGGEFHQTLLSYRDSHLMNLPNDDHIYVEDIDTDGFHIDYLHPQYPQYSTIDRCYFITGKDDAIDHHLARLKITNCWIEDFVHEGVAASGGDTVKIFNTVAIKNDQGFEAGWTESGVNKGPFVFIDHCVAVENNVGLRIGDSYDWTYKDFMKVTNTILYQNQDNIWNYLNSTHAPLPGALNISYSMTNDPDYDNSAFCITGVPQFDSDYDLLPGSPGIGMGMNGKNMGLINSIVPEPGVVVINEIIYKSPPDFDTGDWIELYNPSQRTQYLSGWILKDDNDAHIFKIPEEVILPADGYWVICTDTIAFRRFHPAIKNISGNIPFGFGERDQVRLFTQQGQIIDSIAYKNTPPWPPEADGTGYSLECLNPRKNRSLPDNWAKSLSFGGTPGGANQCVGIEEEPENKLPTQFILEQNYPNPFNPETRIIYAIPRPGRIKLSIYDLLGRQVLQINDSQSRPAGRYQFNLDSHELAGGIYFYQVQFVDERGKVEVWNRKMVVVK
ncbi:CotH kinase family protein [candidate division KSB1 bacterium]|nr:CotH kinase family protein [candidate division KSB1 bacterium]